MLATNAPTRLYSSPGIPVLDSPTIPFRDQPTSVQVRASGTRRIDRDDAASSAGKRLYSPTPAVSLTVPVARAKKKSRPFGAIALCVVSLIFGIVAGHVVRDGIGRAPHATSSRTPRAADVSRDGIAFENVALAPSAEPAALAKAPIASTKRVRKVGTRPAATARFGATTTTGDKLFEDLEPSFRVSQ